MNIKKETICNFNDDSLNIKEEKVFKVEIEESVLSQLTSLNNVKFEYKDEADLEPVSSVYIRDYFLNTSESETHSQIKIECKDEESVSNDISEVTASDYFVNTSDLTNYKVGLENDCDNIVETECLSYESDLDFLKQEPDCLNRPCSKNTVKNGIKKQKYRCLLCQKKNKTAYVDYVKNNFPEKFTYQEFAKEFTAEFYDANRWADIFAKSGAKYVVLTSKHHEGYTLWPSKYSYSWNAVDVGPGRDVLGQLATAVRAKNLTFGVYHSLYEWFHPVYASDKKSNWTSQEFVDNKIIPEMKELVETYKPSVIWSDGDWEAPDTYWKSAEFVAWLYNESPVKDFVVVNDRWGQGTTCLHGDFYTCSDRYNPGTLQEHKWENAMTIDKDSWGFRRNANISDYFNTDQLISELVSTVSCGGNLLMNIGPTKDGMIAPIFQERLQEIGLWLSINGEAIYSTKPWIVQNDTLTSGVWYTSKGSTVYAIVLHWTGSGTNNTIDLASATELFKDSKTTVAMVGNEDDGALSWTLKDNAVKIQFPDMATVKSKWAYVLKIVPAASSVMVDRV